MARIAVAGFQHETNTFAPSRTGFDTFVEADAWPGLLTGAEVLPGMAGKNLPLAGFAAAAAAAPETDLLPVLWCSAEPGGKVTDDAFERIAGMLVDGIRAAGPLDGLYLDLHGAMVTDSHDDGEGELLARLRAAVGPDLPVAVSLDLHANVTRRMVEHAGVIAIFRTYPHLDMAATGARCLPLLSRVIADGPPAKAFRQAPFLIPLQAQYTGADPCRGLYARLGDLPAGATADIALGFTAADIPDAGPSVVAYAEDQARADAVADGLMQAILDAEPEFDAGMLGAAEAVRAAMAAPPGRPVVIADVQDNPGAGATSDTTGLLAALVAAGAQDALLGVIADAETAAEAHRHGVGAGFEAALGGRSGLPGEAPFRATMRVEALSDGRFAFTGEMYGGSTAEIGPTALLSIGGVRVVVSTKRCQCLDRALFTHLGADPAAARIVTVKSTVHFRADFEPIAGAVLVAEVPGAFPCRLDRVHYRRLRRGMRLGPLGPPVSADN